MVVAPAGVPVDDFDKLGDCASTVANDLGRVTARGGDHPAADDQDAEIGARWRYFSTTICDQSSARKAS